MNRSYTTRLGWLSPMVACGCALAGCSSGTSSSGSSGSGQTTLSCLVEIEGASTSCELYEAAGPDAAEAIAAVRTQRCVSAPGEKDTVLASCPTADNLGGCKTPVNVVGGANAQVTVTRFGYKSATGFQTAQDVQKNCTAPNATYVPAP
jgi:hypothetical protein